MLFSLLLSAAAAPQMHHKSSMPSVQPHVVIGRTIVTLGMQSSIAQHQLETEYQVKYLNTSPVAEIWVMVKGSEYPFADLYVQDNVVIGVDHEVLNREMRPEADDLFDALFVVLAKFENEHNTACHIQTGSGYVPDMSMSKANFTLNCGLYRVVVLRNQFKGSAGELEAAFIVREEIGQTGN